jgi:DNA-directed RNA polymerase subunit RPC12/RpoP
MAIEIVEKITICEGTCWKCKTSIRCLPSDTELDYSHINYDSYRYPDPPEQYVHCPKCNSRISVVSKQIEKPNPEN